MTGQFQNAIVTKH